MKNLILLLLMVGFFTPIHAQKLSPKEIPPVVMLVFTQNHPTIRAVHWSKVCKDYGAKYDRNKKGILITYDSLGKVIKTQEEIIYNTIPLTIINYMKKNHKKSKVKKAFKITGFTGNVTYLLRIGLVDITF